MPDDEDSRASDAKVNWISSMSASAVRASSNRPVPSSSETEAAEPSMVWTSLGIRPCSKSSSRCGNKLSGFPYDDWL